MKKQIRLNAFDMNCIGHLSAGLWTHPRDRAHTYKDLEYWLELAKLLERGKFDAIFLADVLGVYDVYHGNADAALRQCAQVPVNDPVLVIPAMATVTEHLGFGVTCTLSFEPPYQFARRMSTLDHLTKGRAGWNIVTGYLDSAARGRVSTRRPRTICAKTSRMNIWRSCTSFGRAAGKTTRWCVIVKTAYLRVLIRSTKFIITGNITVSMRSISVNLRHRARLFYI